MTWRRLDQSQAESVYSAGTHCTTEKYVSTLCAGSLCGVHSVVVSTLGRNLRVPGSIPGEHTPPTFPNCNVVAACGDVPTI